MARKTKTLVIKDRGQDKTFVITEKSAADAERWATRLIFAIGRSGVDIDIDDALASGAAGLMGMAIQKLVGMDFDEAQVLLDDMMSCVEFMPDPKAQFTRKLIEDDIEDVSTLFRLRSEVVELHTGFRITDALSKFGASVKSRASTSTPTSPPQSEQ